MESQSLKSLVQRLFTDNQFLQSFLRTPGEALAGEPVSPEERRALLRLRSRLATAGGPGSPIDGPTGEWP